MTLEQNPYTPPQLEVNAVRVSVPHTTSIRREALRGAIFGAKITGLIVGSCMLLGAAISLATMVNATRAGQGAGLDSGIAKDIVEAVVGLFFMSMGGGAIGSLVMTLAALMRSSPSKPDNNQVQKQ